MLCSLSLVIGWLVIHSNAGAPEGGRQASVCTTDVQTSDVLVPSFLLLESPAASPAPGPAGLT